MSQRGSPTKKHVSLKTATGQKSGHSRRAHVVAMASDAAVSSSSTPATNNSRRDHGTAGEGLVTRKELTQLCKSRGIISVGHQLSKYRNASAKARKQARSIEERQEQDVHRIYRALILRKVREIVKFWPIMLEHEHLHTVQPRMVQYVLENCLKRKVYGFVEDSVAKRQKKNKSKSVTV